MKKITLLFIALVGIFTFSVNSASAQKASDVIGIWLNADGDAHIQVYQEGNKYFGKIVWMLTPNDPETGKPKTDNLNPDPALQSRPRMGLLLLKDFVFDDDEWNEGTVYDPKSGKTYSCYMEFEDEDNLNTLKIRGYIGVSLLGKTTYWTRVE
ncbi:MAG: SIGNAL peptide protein [Bacteroidetes bacterium GWF2_41_31]|nr:MAG: SIGNAL peptide protein [Bacteroidetes bacterium GWF2_41_31]OFZ07101.1 MAG: SIGNAL peptide protein [Bacteroidetes bacterium RIFOXYB12_FULL_41_6]